jgi:Flp pilus assembly protein TadB
MVAFAAYSVWTGWQALTLREWLFQVGWMAVVGVVLAIGPPSVALKELRRRRIGRSA